jgi:hypothetical protein
LIECIDIVEQGLRRRELLLQGGEGIGEGAWRAGQPHCVVFVPHVLDEADECVVEFRCRLGELLQGRIGSACGEGIEDLPNRAEAALSGLELLGDGRIRLERDR